MRVINGGILNHNAPHAPIRKPRSADWQRIEEAKRRRQIERKVKPAPVPSARPPSSFGNSDGAKLSILICSLFDRSAKLDRLLAVLVPQMMADVEILVECDGGEITVGEKRNKLLQRSKGEYVCFVDDDDLVSNDYILSIIQALSTKPDCVGFEGLLKTKGNLDKKFIHSLQYKTWFEKKGVYYRCPNHLNPIKKEYAERVKFFHKNNGEDLDFSYSVAPLLTTEVFINKPLYFYIP